MRKLLAVLTIVLLVQLASGSQGLYLKMEHQSDLADHGPGPFMIHQAEFREPNAAYPSNRCVLRLHDADVTNPEFGNVDYTPGTIIQAQGAIPEGVSTDFEDGNLPWGEKTAEDIYNSLISSDEGFHGAENEGTEQYVHTNSEIIGTGFKLSGNTLCGYENSDAEQNPRWYMCGVNDKQVYSSDSSYYTCEGGSWTETEITENTNDEENAGNEADNNEDNNDNTQQETQETQENGNEENGGQSLCSGEFDAWLTESKVADYPVEIRGCTTDDLEQINVMMRYDDGVSSYSTLSIEPSGISCNGGECEVTNVEYNEHDDREYGFTMEITDGKNFADLNKPVDVDTDLIALKETYPGGRAGSTGSEWLEEACSGNTYSCVDSEQPYKANLVATVGLKTGYTPGSNVVLTEGQTVRFPEGCDYQATYVYQNQPKMKMWHSGTHTSETSIGDTESFETSEGTEIEINSWNTDEVSLSATCSEWETQNEDNNTSGNNSSTNQSSQEIDTDITWINYCQNQDSGDLTQSENIVNCISSCYGESKDSSAEGSDDLTCGDLVKSFCGSTESDYEEEGDTARCS